MLAYVRDYQPDVLKFIYDTDLLRRAPFLAAMRAVRYGAVPTVIHIGTWQHALDAIVAGATAVTHLDDDAVIPADVLAAWQASPTLSIPTMAVQGDLANFVQQPELLNSPLLNALLPRWAVQSFRAPERFSDKGQRVLAWQRQLRFNDLQSLGLLSHAGVRFLAGSDTNNQGTVQGFSLHRELVLLRASGVGPWETLAAATTEAAAFLRRPLGTETGQVAELVLLAGNPIEAIDNTQRIVAVVHHGKLVHRGR